MEKGNDARKYIRVDDTSEVWGVTFKVASTSLRESLPPKPRNYTELRSGDHVRIIVRDPRDRMVSAWRWFTLNVNSYLPEILAASPEDHEYILDKRAPFNEWTQTALRHWNAHWAPQTEIHPRWREFELIPIYDIHKLGWGHKKKTREDNSWEQYYDEATLALVNEVYSEDLEMWKEIKDGTDTRANRLL